MANRLKMAKVHAIQVLRSRSWSIRWIARELGIHRDTVSHYVRRGPSRAGPGPPKPAISITGSGDSDSPSWDDESGPAISITGSAGRRIPCEPYRAVINEMLERGLSAQRIWQDLQADHGFPDSYQSVQRFVRKLRAKSPLPFRRME